MSQRVFVLPARLAPILTLGLLLGACTEVPAQGVTPTTPTPAVSAALSPQSLVFSTTKSDVSAAQSVSLVNTGTTPLTVTTLSVGGQDAAAFGLDAQALPVTLAAGEHLNLHVSFRPQGKTGVLSAALNVAVKDAAALNTGLSGLSAQGLEGENEPPLAQVVRALTLNTNIGGDQLILGTTAPLLGREVSAGLFRKTGSGPVSLTPVARYSPDGVLPFGFFTLQGSQPTPHETGTVALHQYQTLNPGLGSGGTAFDPGDQQFGVYTGATAYSEAPDYSLDSLNTGSFKNGTARPHHAMRVYPLLDQSGTQIAGRYLIGVEASANGDYQDAVFVLQGAAPVQP